MRALSWKEPYGSLMLHGKIETRTWRTDIRGPILICCSKKGYTVKQVYDISGSAQLTRATMCLHKDENWKWDGMNGLAIAIGTLAKCRPMRKENEDLCFVQYHPDLWEHVYENVIAFPNPIEIKGQMGFFNIPGTLGVNLLEWYMKQLKNQETK